MLEDSSTNKLKNSEKNKYKKIQNYFVDFSNNTGIHGFKYIGENGRSASEKFWWLIVFCVCLYMCVSLVLTTWKKWDENPVFISFSQIHKNIWEIPFPAVTVCPEVKIKHTKYNFASYYEKVLEKVNLTEEESKKFNDALLVCQVYPNGEAKHIADSNTINFFIENAPSIKEVFGVTGWMSQWGEHKKIFSPIFTNDGLCFSFNMLDKKDLFTNLTHIEDEHINHQSVSHWTLDNNYIKTKKEVYPRRALSTSETSSLTIVLVTTKADVDKMCNYQIGFKVMLHHPADSPRKTTRTLQIRHKDYNILIKPDITTTSWSLTNYDPQRRKCYFANERSLKFYKLYTQENCQIECLANYTLHRCDCVPYYMPREKSTSVCGSGKFWCGIKAEEELLYQNMGLDEELLANGTSISCNCLPSCTSILYNTEVLEMNYDTHSDSNKSAYSYLKIYFKDDKFGPIERNELFGDTDFWASCGGLFGLFTGFSVMTCVEIIYFLTIRWMCNIWKIRHRVSTSSPLAQ